MGENAEGDAPGVIEMQVADNTRHYAGEEEVVFEAEEDGNSFHPDTPDELK